MKKLLTILLLVLAFGLITTSSAQDLSLKAIAPQVGVIFPENFDMGFHFGVKANFGEVTTNLGLYPFVNYWTASGSEFSTDISLSNFQLGADVHYPIESAKGFYVGGGLSLNFLSFSADNYPAFDNSDTKIGIGLLGGYEFPLSGKTAFIQGKYDIISDASTIMITAGLYFDLKK